MIKLATRLLSSAIVVVAVCTALTVSAWAQTNDGDYQTNASGNWNATSTWARFNGEREIWVTPAPSPTSSDGVITILSGHTVTVTANVTIDQTIIESEGQITVASGDTLTIADGSGYDLTVFGTVLNQGTITASGTATWALYSGATFIQNTTTSISTVLDAATIDVASTFEYKDSGNPEVDGRTYGTLKLTTASSKTYTSTGTNLLWVQGDFLIGLGVIWDSGNFAGDIRVSGNTTIDGSWTGSGAGNMGNHSFRRSFTVNGTYSLETTGGTQGDIEFLADFVNNGTFTAPSHRDVKFNLEGRQTISGTSTTTFKNGFIVPYWSGGLTIASTATVNVGSGATATVDADLTVEGILTGGGSLVFDGRNRTLSNDGVVDVATTFQNNGGDTKYIAGTGSWKSLTIAAGCHTRVRGSHSFTGAGTPFSVSGTVTLESESTITYSGASSQIVAPLTYASLEINNSAGVSLPSSLTVNESLEIPHGSLNTLSDTLILGSYATLDETAPSGVVGNLYTARACTSGTAQDFGGMGLEITVTGDIGAVSMSVTRATGTAWPISGVTTIRRYFDISPAVNSGLNATLGFKYAESELNGTTESNLQLYKSTDGGTSWSPQGGTVNTSADTLALTGIGSFSLWTAGTPSISPPTLSGISPSAAELGTTLNVTLTGTNFANGGSTVGFSGSGITVNSVTFNSSTQIVANISVSSGAPVGLRNVSVTTSQGTATLTNAFEVYIPQNPLPSIVSISPNSGVRLQSLAVTVTGGGFLVGLTTVSFGDGITVSSVTGNSTTLTVQIVIGANASLGPRTVTFTNPAPGGGTATRPGAFSVVNPAPGILGITPSVGARGRTVSVTLTGTDFVAGSTTVVAGSGISVDSVVAVSPTKITALFSIARSAATGLRDITVTNPSPGGGSATLAGSFTVQNPSPTFVGISPNVGSLGQTLNVVLSGSDFLSGVSSVDFGSGIVVNSVTVDTGGTHITANLTIGTGSAVGTRNVTVTNSAPGGGSMSLSSAFTVGNPVPTLLSLSPIAGARGQTLSVALVGSNFIAGVSSVSFGPGVTVNSVAVNTAGSITANISIASDAVLASRNVVVTNSAPGGGSATLSFAFSVENAAPTISSISPVSSSRGQVLNVTIIGTNFSTGTTSVIFGSGITVNSLTFNSLTQMVAAITVAADAALGTRNVIVTNSPPGGGSATLSSAFSIQNPAPTLASLTPATGVRGQLVVVKLTGTNFLDGLTTADFGAGVTVNALVVASSTEASASISISAGSALGARDVSVTNPPPGGGTVTLAGAFTVANPAPTISAIVPASAGRGSVLTVVITGTQFVTSISSLSLGADISVSNLVVKSPTELQASITIAVIATPGARNVTVTNASPGGGSASLTSGFTITSGPATGIEGYIGDVPDQYALQEAYPNPFNPSTRIRYGIPEDSRIKLDVYNMLGNIVSELIDGARSKGLYEVQWHADNLPSGVYLVRLQAESLESTKRFIGSRKVVLVK